MIDARAALSLVDAKIAEHEAALRALRALRADLDGGRDSVPAGLGDQPGEAAGNALPKDPAGGSPAPAADRRPGSAVARVRAALLSGPKQKVELARLLGVTAPSLTAPLRHPWFRKVGPDEVRSPWELTELGRLGGGPGPGSAGPTRPPQ